MRCSLRQRRPARHDPPVPAACPCQRRCRHHLPGGGRRDYHFVLAGRYFEKRSKRQASATLLALIDLGAKHATVLFQGFEVRVPLDQVKVGEEFVVRPGEKMATDGIIVSAHSAVDASI